MPDWSSIRQALEAGGVISSSTGVPVSGGDISAAWRLATKNGDLFIKTGPVSSEPMFAAEAAGLVELAGARALRVPECIASGRFDGGAFLALEWLEFGPADGGVERRLGEQLAKLHRKCSERFGWHRDNTIGLTPQINDWCDSWIDFFQEHRLGYQLRLAFENGFRSELQECGERLLRRLPIFFDDYEPLASLLHGDLWGGNWACCDGEPVLFDPAVYYGDRESDLAMTRLFGGFGPGFYEAYEGAWPLAAGHRERRGLYQLYHVLNHLNLFGSAYLARARGLMDTLLEDTK